MKSTETRLFVCSTAFFKLIKTGPLWWELILRRPSWSPHRRPVMAVIHKTTSRSLQRCNSCIVWIYGLIGNKIRLKPSSNPHMIKVPAGYTHDLCVKGPDAHGVGIHVVLNLFIQIGHLITLNCYHPMPLDSYGHIRQLRSFVDSYDHTSTVTIIPRGQLRSCRRCLVCKLRSYHESFTSPYFKNKCTD